jgi:hypothetical protein
MGVILPNRKVCGALNEMVGKTSLPDRKFGGELMREDSLDEVHDLGEGLAARRQDEVSMIRHEDVGVEFVVRAVVVEGFEEEFGVPGDLEDAATVVADGGEEEGALRGGSLRGGHPLSLGARGPAEREERRAFGRAVFACGGAVLARLKACPSGVV